MSWYKRLLAMPITENTPCPNCGAVIIVDVKQPITTLKSEPYEVSETGQCITQCKGCKSWLLLDYKFDFMKSMLARGTFTIIDEAQANELENSGVMRVKSIII